MTRPAPTHTPEGNLDGTHWIRRIFETVKTISQGGMTVLLVEQNVRHALEISHRAYVLETGRIVLEGPAQDLIHHDHVRAAYLGL